MARPNDIELERTGGFDVIGTRWEIETEAPLGVQLRARLDRIESFDATYSRFRPDSLVSRVANAIGGRFEFPHDAIALFELYDDLGAVTGGAVDPLVGRDLELLGYDAAYSLTPADETTRRRELAAGRPQWFADVLREGATVITRRPLVIDVGAAGKGYLVDIVTEISWTPASGHAWLTRAATSARWESRSRSVSDWSTRSTHAPSSGS